MVPSERRNHTRATFAPDVTTESKTVAIEGLVATITSLTPHGLSVRSSETLPTDAIIRITLPAYRRVIVTKIQKVWESLKPTGSDYGFHFTKLSVSDYRALRDTYQTLLEKDGPTENRRRGER